MSPPPSDVDVWFEGLMHNADQTYRSLIAKGLIEDPLSVVLGGSGRGWANSCQFHKADAGR